MLHGRMNDKSAANKPFSISGVAGFADTFVQGGCSVWDIMFSAKALRPLKLAMLCTPLMRFYIFIVVTLIASCSEQASQTVALDSVSRESVRLDSASSIPEMDRDSAWSHFDTKYAFNSFSVKAYAGPLAKPDYSSVSYGHEKGFQEFMEERIEGMAINFGGKYTIVELSCGAMCSALYLIDRKTGEIFLFPMVDGHWGYKYYPNSTLLLANSSLVNDSLTGYLDHWGIKPEFYKWTGKGFELLP